MRGICIETGATTVLQEGANYFLFDHGPNNFYVSRFDNVNAHCGSYERKFFKLIEDKTQRFIARVAKWRAGYNVGDEFIISDPGPNGYFNVYLMDGRIIGSYITNFFEVIGPYEEQKNNVPIKRPEMPNFTKELPPVALPLPEAIAPKFEPKPEPKRPKNKLDQLEAAGQLNIFDFLEG